MLASLPGVESDNTLSIADKVISLLTLFSTFMDIAVPIPFESAALRFVVRLNIVSTLSMLCARSILTCSADIVPSLEYTTAFSGNAWPGIA